MAVLTIKWVESEQIEYNATTYMYFGGAALDVNSPGYLCVSNVLPCIVDYMPQNVLMCKEHSLSI